MKKRLTALLTAGTLLLTGCSSLLRREYISVTPHNVAPTAEGDPSTLRADSHQELVNALVYLVSQGQEEGTIRLYTDWEDPASHLDSACLEVISEDPLGAYAVNVFEYDISQLVTYDEAVVHIDYRRTREQIRSIVPATGTTIIRNELKTALGSFAPECVLRIGYFDRDEDFLLALAEQAFYDDPLSAVDFPDIEIAIYPDHGRRRIAELVFHYHLEEEELRSRKSMLAQELVQLGRTVPFATDIPYIFSAADALLRVAEYRPEGGPTAWHALTEGSANSQGMALAFAALCQQLHIPCQVAEGAVGATPHYWNVVSTNEGWRHLDLTLSPSTLLLDTQLTERGYSWPSSTLPKCILPPSAP